MSEVDRRRYEWRLHHGAWGPLLSIEPPGDGGRRTVYGKGDTHYYHESAVRELVKALQLLKRGDCWCEVAIGNPMFQGRHTQKCLMVQELFTHYKKLIDAT